MNNLEKEAEEYANQFSFISENKGFIAHKKNSYIDGVNSNYVKQEIIKAKIKLLENLNKEFNRMLDFYKDDFGSGNDFYNYAIKDVIFLNTKKIENLKLL